MDVEVSFTIRSTDEAARMSRRWYYWPRILVRNLYGFALVGFLMFFGCSLLVKSIFVSKPDLSGAGTGILMMAVPIVGFYWLRRRDIRKATEMLAAINPLKLSFTADGIHTQEKSGASNFVPWSNFDGFREGQAVILLRETGKSQYRVIPKDTVSIMTVEQIRSAVRSHLPELP